MEKKKTFSNIFRVLMPIILGGGILYWMYRDLDVKSLTLVLNQVDWSWMAVSLVFGVLAQLFRGWRWRLLLDPLDEHPRTSTCVNAVLLSYAASLVVPRIGEVMRCGILKRMDKTSFTKALGTVVTERLIDSLIMLVVTAGTILLQAKIFMHFFKVTGVDVEGYLAHLSSTGLWVAVCCALAAIGLIIGMLYRFSIFSKVKGTLKNILEGMTSLALVKGKWKFTIYSLLIWLCYFFHFYLTFYCFGFTAHLGWMAGLICFVVGTIAVIVPTPNGAGPWHLAVKTILTLYGVAENMAVMFVLIVHTVQTLLLMLLGLYAWIALNLSPKRK